jgi:TolA-binding protein
MKRLLIVGLVLGTFGPAWLMGQKKEDIVAIQRDLANLEDQVKQLQRAQDEKMAALQQMLQQSVDASGHVNTGLAAVQKEIDAKLGDQQTKLVAPLATLGAKIDQMADDLRSTSVNIADLVRKVDKLNARLDDVSNAMRSMQAPPQAPPPAGATGVPGVPGGTAPQSQVPAVSSEVAWQNAFRDYSTGKQELAMQEFNDIVKNYPGTDTAASAQYYIGYLYFNAQQYEDAVKAFDVLLTFNENSKTQDALYYKGVALLKAGHNTLAADTLKEFLRRYPTNEHGDQAKKDLRLLGVHPPAQSRK